MRQGPIGWVEYMNSEFILTTADVIGKFCQK